MKELYAVVNLHFRRDQSPGNIPDLAEEPSVEVYDTKEEAVHEAWMAVQEEDEYPLMAMVVHFDTAGVATILYTFGVTLAAMYQQGALMWGRLNGVVNTIRPEVNKHQQMAPSGGV